MKSRVLKRRGKPETNSSSSHSLVVEVGSNSVLNSCAEFGPISEDGELHITPTTQDFGWQWAIWDDPATKLAYLLHDGFDKERMVSILNANLVGKFGVTSIRLPNLKDGYGIDHQSIGTSSEVRDLSDEDVWQFLIGPSVIRGGNDNEPGPYDNDDDYGGDEE